MMESLPWEEVFACEGFRIRLQRSADRASLQWLWHGDYRELLLPDELASLMRSIEAELRSGVERVEMHFEQLLSVNSSMMVQIARLLRDLASRCPHLRVFYDPGNEFQAVLFPILAQRLTPAVDASRLDESTPMFQAVKGAEVQR